MFLVHCSEMFMMTSGWRETVACDAPDVAMTWLETDADAAAEPPGCPDDGPATGTSTSMAEEAAANYSEWDSSATVASFRQTRAGADV